MTLAEILWRIAELAPDLIRIEPRKPLYTGGPEYGPLLFWDNSLSVKASKHDCLAVRRAGADALEVRPYDVPLLLPGLIAACEKRGWYWQLNPVAYAKHPYGARVSDWDRIRWQWDGETPTHALAGALLKALEATHD